MMEDEWATVRVGKRVVFVKNDGTGRRKWYLVEGRESSRYNVSISFTCDCMWSTMHPDKPCTHIRACLKKLYGDTNSTKKKRV